MKLKPFFVISQIGIFIIFSIRSVAERGGRYGSRGVDFGPICTDFDIGPIPLKIYRRFFTRTCIKYMKHLPVLEQVTACLFALI